MNKEQPYEVLGIGSACMDLLASIDDEFLAFVPGEKGGAYAIDLELLNQILSRIKKTPVMTTGGSCANTIKGLAHLSIKCALLSHLGDDELGTKFSQTMNEIGVVGLFSTSARPTSRVLCLITPDGQRTMRFCGGSDEISDTFLHADYFAGVKLVHMEAYSLRNKKLAIKVLQLAKEAGATISIDLSSFEIVREYRSTLQEILPQYVDIVFANADETHALTGLSPTEGSIKLQQMCPIAVILMGKEGCLVGHQGKLFKNPSFSVELIDSTGAGDLFASGFLYGYLQGYPLEECATLGNRLGGAVVEVQGADLPPKKWKIIQDQLQTMNI